mmetsp:Transcript_94990/g.188169  ORF Transcript_94990/g.188169 Transcript_94990/m.188169 type:complete len:207 (+) Transcript_94990:67-687(+)
MADTTKAGKKKNRKQHKKPSRDDLQITWLKQIPPRQCSATAGPGSFVSINQEGFIHELPAEAPNKASWTVGDKVDANADGEPLKVTLGKREILSGMDLAMEGMCVGDKISVVIPPHMAYDDPVYDGVWDKPGKRKPVPDGTTMRYHISLVGVQNGVVVKRTDYTPMFLALGVIILILGGLAMLVFRSTGAKANKTSKKDKEKKKKR